LGFALLWNINSQLMPSCFNKFSMEGPVSVMEPLDFGVHEAASV